MFVLGLLMLLAMSSLRSQVPSRFVNNLGLSSLAASLNWVDLAAGKLAITTTTTGAAGAVAAITAVAASLAALGTSLSGINLSVREFSVSTLLGAAVNLAVLAEAVVL